jgi:uncharacterized protein (DUF2336 family)
MKATASSELIAELDAAMKNGPPGRRSRILQCVVDLFVAGADRLNHSQIRIFDDVLVALIERAEARTLPQLSACLAGLTIAPEGAVRLLAHHESAAVAAPVLLKSQALSDSSLLELASHCSQQHLAAISGRQTLGQALTDVILKHAGKDTCRSLAKNAGARFSAQGYASLLAKAEHDDTVAEALGLRPDLPADILKHLLAKATNTVRARLLKGASPQLRQRIQATIDAITATADSPPSDRINYPEALAMVDGLNRVGKLNDSSVNGFAIRGERVNVVAALSLLSGATVEVVEELMEQDSGTGLIVACRASRLNWQTALAILNGRGLPSLSKDQVEQGKSLFETLYVSAAQYTIRFEPPVSSAKSGPASKAARAGA